MSQRTQESLEEVMVGYYRGLDGFLGRYMPPMPTEEVEERSEAPSKYSEKPRYIAEKTQPDKQGGLSASHLWS